MQGPGTAPQPHRVAAGALEGHPHGGVPTSVSGHEIAVRGGLLVCDHRTAVSWTVPWEIPAVPHRPHGPPCEGGLSGGLSRSAAPSGRSVAAQQADRPLTPQNRMISSQLFVDRCVRQPPSSVGRLRRWEGKGQSDGDAHKPNHSSGAVTSGGILTRLFYHV